MTRTPSGPISPKQDYQSMVDTSRPFRSVKEAVAVFGERIPVGTEKQKEESSQGSALKKVEAELEEARAEVKVLKERLERRPGGVTREEGDGIGRNKKNGRERMEKNTTLAHILSLVDHQYDGGDVNVNVMMNKKKTNKAKPIVPLVGDYLFAIWKKKPTLFSS